MPHLSVIDIPDPMCGANYPQDKIAGEPVICDRTPHDDTVKHYNSELRFEWW